MVGLSKEEQINIKVREESNTMKDILMLNYTDSYKMLSYKMYHIFDHFVNILSAKKGYTSLFFFFKNFKYFPFRLLGGQ